MVDHSPFLHVTPMISSFVEPSKKFFFENAFQNLARERNSHKITHCKLYTIINLKSLAVG
ncbi:hypothetical protein T4D_11531 [Trichinella pseudospiralis]|uniref:Uncharacterized protein n=1 Tax=Trichinella pseudospiralis TaxID=6337 RepID=A0A0V1FBM0_TRIPS|nr:hypothetical protein T4D_11531 [Trichinella pseudospiralis]